MSRISSRLLLWSPRILTIAFAGFLSLFSLDVFSETSGFWKTSLALGMHLIPVVVVLIILALAWRWAWTGAILYALAAFAYGLKSLPAHPSWFLAIGIPLLAISGLFLVNWLNRSQLEIAKPTAP